MNERLLDSASPYLQSHAGNPVAWYPWGQEAFDEAKRRDVPVFVSIGYSTCHWCHVMARESFEDAATALDLDEGFVAVKVDREEHPDVDAAYMAAAAAFTPNLGWPLSVFVTPDGRPFYAGTYFPPEPRGEIPAFRQVLAAVREAWALRRDEVDGTGEALLTALADVRQKNRATTADAVSSDDVLAAARQLAAREDPEFGGFWDGNPAAPKFPIATALNFLASRLVRQDAPDAADVARRALAAMLASPMHDAVEGGFFRYATKRDWSDPHYERMLTDNALLLDLAVSLGDEAASTAVADFLIDELQQPEGGFGAAQDSESVIDGEWSEGGYYARESRFGLARPRVDGKLVTGWNGLAIGALARASARWDNPDWLAAAEWAADAVLTNNVNDDGLLMRASLDEIPSRARATLADYGQLATGLVALAVAAGDPRYADVGRTLVDACIAADGSIRVPGGGDSILVEQGLTPPDAASDADEPSGFAAVAEAAAQLWLLGAGDRYRDLAERVVQAHSDRVVAYPLAYGTLLRVAAVLSTPPRQIVVVADSASDPLARRAAATGADLVVQVSTEFARMWDEEGFDLFAGKVPVNGQATAYDCRDFACRLPTTDPDRL